MSNRLYDTEVALHDLRQVKLAGDATGASALLGALIDTAVAPGERRKLSDMLLFTAMFIGDLRAAERIVPMHVPRFGPVTLRIDATLPGAQVFRWRHEQEFTGFDFHPGLFEQPQNMLFMIYSRWAAWLRFAAAYAALNRPSGFATVDVGDWSSGVGMVFCDNREHAFLVPDSSFLSSDGYRETLAQYVSAPKPWAERARTALWRGASTGTAEGGLMMLPRVRLCQMASDPSSKGLIDAGITAVVQASSAAESAQLVGSGLMRDHVPVGQFHHHKFQIDIDGNTNSWPGLFQKLLTGSPVLKVASPAGYRQWYYDRLVPWQNFIPVRSDMADLTEVLSFLLEHDDVAERVGAAGLSLARSMDVSTEVRRCADVVAGAFNESVFRAARQSASR